MCTDHNKSLDIAKLSFVVIRLNSGDMHAVIKSHLDIFMPFLDTQENTRCVYRIHNNYNLYFCVIDFE